MWNIILTALNGALLLLFIILMFSFRHTYKKIKDQQAQKFEAIKEAIEKSLEEIRKNTDVMLDGLVLAQTKDKLGLVKLVSKKKELEKEVVEQIQKEVEQEEKIKQETLEPVKKDYTPVD